MGGDAGGVFVGLGRDRLALLVGLRLEDQRGDPENLQQGQQQGGEQAGEAGGLGDALDHSGSLATQWQGKPELCRVSWAALCTASMCEKPAK